MMHHLVADFLERLLNTVYQNMMENQKYLLPFNELHYIHIQPKENGLLMMSVSLQKM